MYLWWEGPLMDLLLMLILADDPTSLLESTWCLFGSHDAATTDDSSSQLLHWIDGTNWWGKKGWCPADPWWLPRSPPPWRNWSQSNGNIDLQPYQVPLIRSKCSNMLMVAWLMITGADYPLYPDTHWSTLIFSKCYIINNGWWFISLFHSFHIMW